LLPSSGEGATNAPETGGKRTSRQSCASLITNNPRVQRQQDEARLVSLLELCCLCRGGFVFLAE